MSGHLHTHMNMSQCGSSVYKMGQVPPSHHYITWPRPEDHQLTVTWQVRRWPAELVHFIQWSPWLSLHLFLDSYFFSPCRKILCSSPWRFLWSSLFFSMLYLQVNTHTHTLHSFNSIYTVWYPLYDCVEQCMQYVSLHTISTEMDRTLTSATNSVVFVSAAPAEAEEKAPG